MKKIIISSLLITFFISRIQAQTYSREISTDSLLRMFRKESPFKVLGEFSSQYFSDYKGAYFNAELKSYLLKWLSKEDYRQYEIERNIQRFSNDTDYIKLVIKRKLIKQNKEAWLDSIINTPTLYKKFRDSAVIEQLEFYKKDTKLEASYPPDNAISFHSQIAYPESYLVIKQYWTELGKPVWTDNRSYFHNYFSALLQMRDPEAVQLGNEEIARFLRSKGKSEDPVYFLSLITHNPNPYGIAKLLELLPVDVRFETLSDGTMEQFNCLLIKSLIEQLYFNNLPLDPPLKRTSPCEVQLKNVKAFKEAGQKLIKKYQEDEKYWMDNMPYKKK